MTPVAFSTALHRAQGSVGVQRKLGELRKLRRRLIDVPLQQVERARRRLIDEDVDVLLLGDSSMLCWSLRDTDRSTLATLLGQRLGNVVPVCGPGFGAEVYAETLRILGTLDKRPTAVVFTSTLRCSTGTHFLADPVYGYRRSIDHLAKVRSGRRRIRYVGRGTTTATEAERAAFLAQPVESRWTGEQTIGYYRNQITGLGLPPWPMELERVRFDYFYGEVLRPDHPGLQNLTAFAQRLEEYGVPVVGTWTRPPIQRGEMHFPGEFERHLRSQVALHDAALARGSGSIGPLLDIHLEDHEFEDSANATEHYAYPGRVKYADAIADAVRERTGR